MMNVQKSNEPACPAHKAVTLKNNGVLSTVQGREKNLYSVYRLHELGHFIPAKLFKTRVEKFYLFFDVKYS